MSHADINKYNQKFLIRNIKEIYLCAQFNFSFLNEVINRLGKINSFNPENKMKFIIS